MNYETIYLDVSLLSNYDEKVKVLKSFLKLQWEKVDSDLFTNSGLIPKPNVNWYCLKWNGLTEPKYPVYIPDECKILNYQPFY